eukprot:355524-Chlamydomonas_euryale.AAC.19
MDAGSNGPAQRGRCFEVSCSAGYISDNYGESFDRRGACYDTSASVVVRTVDSCPCNYPRNQYVCMHAVHILTSQV